MSNKKSVLYLVSHPIQYQAPLLRFISNFVSINLTTIFYWEKTPDAHFDEGFGQKIRWDVPLLFGYNYQYLDDAARSKNKFQKIKMLWKIISSKKIDIIWTHGYADLYTILAILFAKLKGLKVFVRGESMHFSNSKKSQRKKIFFKILDKLVDRYLAIGSNNKKFYINYGISENKIMLCHYAVDNDFFREKYLQAREVLNSLRENLQLEKNRPIILYASKFITRKYPIDLLNAFFMLPESQIKPYLLFIGTGETLDVVKKVASQSNSDAIRFLGFKNQSELPAYYALADIFVLPSERENWGLVVNEVMNAECAIVVSDQVGCAVDLVKPGVNGFIYPARDVKMLSHYLHLLTTDHDACEKMKHKSGDIISQWGLRESAAGLNAACESLCSFC